jgi:hypothetical protein
MRKSSFSHSVLRSYGLFQLPLDTQSSNGWLGRRGEKLEDSNQEKVVKMLVLMIEMPEQVKICRLWELPENRRPFFAQKLL